MNLSIFFYIFNLSNITFYAKFAYFLSYILIYILPLILLLWIFTKAKKKMYTFSLLFLSSTLSWILAAILKFIFKIPRPFITEGIVPIVNEIGYSFPSEHMAVFSALAISGYFLNKKLGIILIIIAVLIGLSRIVLGVHYPVDILGGACVGGSMSLLLIHIFKKYEYNTYYNTRYSRGYY